MKIAIIHGPGFYYNGGGERIAIEETKGLRQRNHHVDIYTTHLEVDHCFPEETTKLGVKPFFSNLNLPCQAAINMILSSATYPLLIRRLRQYDALICHSQPAIWLGYKVKKPYIAYIHRPNCFIYPKPVDRWNYDINLLILNKVVQSFPLSRKLDLESVRASNRILTTSQWIADWTNLIYRNAPLKCPPAPSDRFHIKGERDFLDFHILTVTRHAPIKRLDWLITMFSKIRKRMDANLTIVGKSTEHTYKLLKQIKEYGLENYVQFRENISDNELLQEYMKAKLYVSCAQMEDFGIAPIEAMACGLPLVVWRSGGTAELVTHGETGFKAKPYDLNDLFYKTIDLLSLNKKGWQRISRNAIAKAKEYTWENHLNVLEKELKEIV